MMFKTKIIIILLVLFYFTATNLFSQTGYYATDSVMMSGVKLIEGTEYQNAKICRVKRGNKIIEFTPYDISEYGFKGDMIYVSKEIKISDSVKRVFLEKLATGKANLYYYRGEKTKTFFLEKDSTLFIEITKKENEGYKEFLKGHTNDCNAVSDAIKLVRYNKKSLAKLTERYNNCTLKLFPFFKYGVIFGYEAAKLNPVAESKIKSLQRISYEYENNYTIGLFLDNPIFVSDFSFRFELFYSKQGFTYYLKEENTDIDLVVNTSSFSIPIIFRYTYPSLKFSPYINFGGVFCYHFKNESSLYETIIDGSIIEINKIPTSLIDKKQAGFNLGGGIQYSLDYRRSVFIEFRYNKLYGISGLDYYNNEVLQVLTGLNF